MIHRALIRAEIPAVKEPQGLSRDCGKRPDGLMLVRWQSWHITTWDVIVAHKLETSYVSQNALQAGSAAAAASVRKTTKYSTLSASHMFFSGGGRDSWSFIGRGPQLPRRNRQKSHALHSRSARNYVPVPTHFCGNSALQYSLPCQHIHSFRVPL